MAFVLSFAVAFGLSLLLTPLAGKAAIRLGIVDAPDHKLKSHKKPTPYLGGASLFLSFALAVMIAKLMVFHTLHGVLAILAGSGLVFALGLVDDMVDLSPGVKFFGQGVAAGLLVFCSVHIQFIKVSWLSALVTVVWVVGLTNAFNLIDVADGLASGVALLAALAFFWVGAETGKLNNMVLAAALAGSCLGFLRYNFFPARIFMGDAGALFLGFTLAAVSMGESYSRVNEVAIVCPLLILGIPIFETFLLMAVRLAKGVSPFRGSHDHMVHRFERVGLTLKQGVLTLYGVTFTLCFLAILSIRLPLELVFLLYAAVGFAGLGFGIWMASIKMETRKG